MELLKVLVAPFICALIGWFTNFLAIKMLFHPRKPKKILFWNLQGIFPKRQAALAHNLGEMIERELISHHDVQKIVLNAQFEAKFKDMVDEYVSSFLEKKLVSAIPMASMFLNGEMMQKLKSMLSKELYNLVPRMLNKFSDELENHIDFSRMVREKVESFSMDKLEEILFSIMKKEFRFVEFMGAVLGFCIGVFQSLFLYL